MPLLQCHHRHSVLNPSSDAFTHIVDHHVTKLHSKCFGHDPGTVPCPADQDDFIFRAESLPKAGHKIRIEFSVACKGCEQHTALHHTRLFPLIIPADVNNRDFVFQQSLKSPGIYFLNLLSRTWKGHEHDHAKEDK